MTGDESCDQKFLQEAHLPSFPAPPEFAETILAESHFSQNLCDSASHSCFDAVLKSRQPALRNPKHLDGLDFGSDLAASETEDIVPACSVVASVGGNVTETKLVALSQSLHIRH